MENLKLLFHLKAASHLIVNHHRKHRTLRWLLRAWVCVGVACGSAAVLGTKGSMVWVAGVILAVGGGLYTRKHERAAHRALQKCIKFKLSIQRHHKWQEKQKQDAHNGRKS